MVGRRKRKMINCQNCGRRYESPSEQTVCMAMYGCCISCNLLNLSEVDLIEIQKRAVELKKAQE